MTRISKGQKSKNFENGKKFENFKTGKIQNFQKPEEFQNGKKFENFKNGKNFKMATKSKMPRIFKIVSYFQKVFSNSNSPPNWKKK